MPNYIVKVALNDELVGFYSVESTIELANLVDESVDPSLCQYALLPYGWGIMFNGPIMIPSKTYPEMSQTGFTQDVFTTLLGDHPCEWKNMFTIGCE